ncbi:DUF2130 domain-containing protein [Spiroplasma endosymbiont of Stenodema calcarata]|uniref:DUF2130 domain-containing protein n=1 Tax=Spiroplasma endosymbiont of Stenodema calcarata TaxID=3139328 RepID=UPI003CCAA0FB
MELEFKCPNCGYNITENNFKNNEKILTNLKILFDMHREEYISNLKTNLVIELQQSFKLELAKTLAEKEAQFEKSKQEELNTLQDIINKQKIDLSNNETNLEKLLAEKENKINIEKQTQIDELKDHIAKLTTTIENNKLELAKTLAEKEAQFEKSKQEELNKLQDIINKQKIDLSNNETNLEKLLAEKENKINIEKQTQIDELKDHIAKLTTTIENNKLELAKTLAEKEAQFEKSKQEELNKLQDIINKQKIDLSNNETNLEKLLAEKETIFLNKQKELMQNYEDEYKKLNVQITELKIANAEKRVIQNKYKGETFEQDVYGELQKAFAPEDKIEKLTSQDKKADYIHEVRNNNIIIGKIVYEVKNADWSNTWEKKLIEDTAKQGAKYGILVATSFNKKYPNIPFKRSDDNSNIYISDPESFIFVGQIIRTLIKVESNLDSLRSDNKYSEKIKLFTSWKEIQLPKLMKLFEDNFKRIEESESSIIKRVDEIRIAREKMYNNWIHNIKNFIEELTF